MRSATRMGEMGDRSTTSAKTSSEALQFEAKRKMKRITTYYNCSFLDIGERTTFNYM